jgi:predicted porin
LAAVAATGAAFAQSSVTIYGKAEVGIQKFSDSSTTMNGVHGSRIGFTAVEDLGGGLKAKAQIEHRFNIDSGTDAGYTPAKTDAVTGVTTPAVARFWNGLSTVGLMGSFGELKLGRYYSANFLGANNKPDPFGGDGAGALRGIGMQTTGAFIRTENIIHYSGNFSGVNVAVSTSIKESAADAQNSFAVGYANGPIAVGVGMNKAGDASLTNLYGTYDLGVAKLAAGMGKSKTAAGLKTDGFLLGATIPAGPGKVLVGLARSKISGGDTNHSKIGLGYYYPLSKRTTVEVTFGRDSKVATNKSGYDLILHHNF